MDSPPPAAVRAWARGRGFPVGDRGRLSPSLVALYLTEHRGQPATGTTAPPGARPAAVSEAAAKAPRRGTTVQARGPWNWPSVEGGPQPARRGRTAQPPAR